ncbi:hypothetical protein WN48_00117 [Eufriesea mexicana]|nr:hypothetical protein WN48_00117 [Eufriesea mexicana]
MRPDNDACSATLFSALGQHLMRKPKYPRVKEIKGCPPDSGFRTSSVDVERRHMEFRVFDEDEGSYSVGIIVCKCTEASGVPTLGRDWCGGVRVKGQQQRPQRWAFEMSYEFRLPGSHRLCASAAVPRCSATLSRQDW